MRPFEVALLFVEILAALVLILAPRDRLRWLDYLVPIPSLMALAQVTAESPRWQMIPAYALAAVLLIWWIARRGFAKGWFDRRGMVKRLAAALVVIGLAISVALPVALPVFRFPHPNGPHAIGTVTYHWTDPTRREVFATDPGTRRELMVQIWYPADVGASRARAPYVEDADALFITQARLHGLPDFTFSHLRYVTTNATVGIPVSAGARTYPVLIFLEGLTGYRQMNTFQVEALVSAGYIVVAIDQPFVAASVVFPDGRQAIGLSKAQIDPLIQQSLNPKEPAPTLKGAAFPNGIIPYLAQDIAFVLDKLAASNIGDPQRLLAGKLDMQKVGIFGVSIGAIVAGEACRVETRLRACLMMDAPMTTGLVRDGLKQPGMWITREAATMRAEGWAAADIRQHQSTMRAAFEVSPAQTYLVRVAGMFHANLTDAPHFSPLVSWLGVTGPIDRRRGHTIINAYSAAFFDRHLKDRRTPLLDDAVAERPEVSFDARRPGHARLGSP
ncbi:MAG: carboxylic ester hydrolase [Alphaproteobacteria bacterium]|nr:MAG: carboxylic ester hydrolase [Alphaproteobacteria bacterium]PZO35586.1 MAG: carboxylic ester hydrolase [Alphaproteobacteria bacterium]